MALAIGDTILENLYEMERGFEVFSRDWSDEGYVKKEGYRRWGFLYNQICSAKQRKPSTLSWNCKVW